MAFILGARSLSFCSHVDPRMLAVAKLAITLSAQDFGFTEEQSRTVAYEAQLVAQGKSHTLHSHHIIDCIAPGHWAAPGFSGAVDAVPMVAGAPKWEWPLIYPVAMAFAAAAKQLFTLITWGGVWDRTMDEIDCSSPASLAAAVAAYEARQNAAGNHRVLLDGPHYEIGRNQ